MKAILIDKQASGVSSDAYTGSAVWRAAPLTDILSCVNVDGTASASPFVTLGVNGRFTLIAGRYRIQGWSMANTNVVGDKLNIELTATGTSPFTGLANETGISVESNLATQFNYVMTLEGNFTLTEPATLFIAHYMSLGGAGAGFGTPASITATNEIYRWIEIYFLGNA